MGKRAISIAFAATCVVIGTHAWAAPEPQLGSGAWQLDFSFHDPQRITVKMPGDEHETTYWYMLYTVTNNTGKDVQFFPSFNLVTNTLKVVEAGEEIGPLVYDAIAARHKKEYPFFAPPADVTGLLLQGKDNARTSVAVFQMFDIKAKEFTVYGGGMSGEIARVSNPSFDETKDESDENPQFFILRKTIAIMYDLPGDETTRSRATPVRRDREWVMR